MEWHATCHHNDPQLMELAKQFCEGRVFPGSLFYLWGHAYEFDGDNNWNVIEEFVKYVSQFSQEIWFAGNTEIADYVTASVSGSTPQTEARSTTPPPRSCGCWWGRRPITFPLAPPLRWRIRVCNSQIT